MDEERKARPLHAGVQARSGTACGVGPEYCGGSPHSLGVVEQTLANWVEVHPGGKLKKVSDKAEVTAEQMEIALHSNLPTPRQQAHMRS